MQVVNIHQAKTQLSRLIEEVSKGKEIIIGKAGKPVAKLTAYQEPKIVRKPGKWKGKVWMSDDFDTLPKEIMQYFEDPEL